MPTASILDVVSDRDIAICSPNVAGWNPLDIGWFLN
jgi:hypothetical protein